MLDVDKIQGGVLLFRGLVLVDHYLLSFLAAPYRVCEPFYCFLQLSLGQLLIVLMYFPLHLKLNYIPLLRVEGLLFGALTGPN